LENSITNNKPINSICCILIPIYKLVPARLERAAVERCLYVLRNYDFVFLHKQSISKEQIVSTYSVALSQVLSYTFLPVEDDILRSAKTYNHFMLSLSFYNRISRWDFVLIFQDDAWILSGNLDKWLNKSFSYVGAPWCRHLGPDPYCVVTGVGNGGLSLRNIKHMKRILHSPQYYLHPVLSVHELISSVGLLCGYGTCHSCLFPVVFIARLIRLFSALFLYPFGVCNNLSYLASKRYNEDVILGLMAKRVFPWLHIPDISEAAHFSIETNPAEVVEAFGVDVPFGCHGWQKHNSRFFLRRYRSYFKSILD
jgi:hypothetical protein